MYVGVVWYVVVVCVGCVWCDVVDGWIVVGWYVVCVCVVDLGGCGVGVCVWLWC